MITDSCDYMQLTRDEVKDLLSTDSVLCLPVGSTEQHGPHLPIGTDSVLADRLTARLVSAYHATYGLWRLPCFDFGLSLEHSGSPGTLSLSVGEYGAIVHAIVRELVRAQAARNLLIVNGHGGNRGVLETLLHEFRDRYGVAAAVIHPSALSGVRSGSRFPEVHGGMSETSVMLELAPHLVALDRLPSALQPGDQPDVASQILDRGVSWPWNSADAHISSDGVIGDAALASRELGSSIVKNAVENAGRVLADLTAFGRRIREGVPPERG